MPLPGPRTQDRPLPGYRNPDHEMPHRWNLWNRPPPVMDAGRTPGTMVTSTRGNVLAPGQVRQMWRQVADYIAAQASYSWTHSAPGPDRPVSLPPALGVTTALRYMARSLYVAGGTDGTRLSALHTKVTPSVKHKPVSVNAGAVRNRPTVRNRMTSFGSRVPTLNVKVSGGQE